MRPIIDDDLQADLRVEAAYRQENTTRYVNRVLREAIEADRSARRSTEQRPITN